MATRCISSREQVLCSDEEFGVQEDIEKVEEKEFQGSAQGVSLIEGLDGRPCLLLSP